VQRVRDAIPGGELVVAGSRVRAGLDAAVNFDGICGALALGAAEGDRGALGDPGSHHAIGIRGGRPEPRPPGRAELYTAAYCARAVIISPLQASAGRPWVAAAYG